MNTQEAQLGGAVVGGSVVVDCSSLSRREVQVDLVETGGHHVPAPPLTFYSVQSAICIYAFCLFHSVKRNVC